MDDNITLWGIHAGRSGEAESLFLNKKVIALGWEAIGDLKAIGDNREAFKAYYASKYPDVNAIKQAYLCKAPSNQVHAGDIVLFYRSKDEMAVTTIGIVERYETHTEAAKIMQLVSRRTVYSQSEIEAMTNKSVRVMLFRLVGHFNKPISLASLKHDANVSGKLMSITKISDDSFSRILRLS